MSLFGLLSMKSTVSALVLFVALSIGAFLYLTLDPDFEVKSPASFRTLRKESPVNAAPSAGLGDIINTARQAWSIINQNRAVADIQTMYGNALPIGVTDPFQLQKWASPPMSRSYTVNIFNRLKQRVLQLTYTLQYTYGGSLDGKGAYLDRVTIVPSRVSVAWGFVFNASVQIGQVYNTGTTDDPIAVLPIDLHYRLVGLNTIERTESFHVTGDGKYFQLNS